MRIAHILSLVLGSPLAFSAVAPVPAFLFGSYKNLPANDPRCLNGLAGNLKVVLSKENCIVFQGKNGKGEWDEAIALCEVNQGRKEKDQPSSMPVVGKTVVQIVSDSKVNSDGSFSADYSNVERTAADRKIVNTMLTSIRGSLQGILLTIDMGVVREESGREQTYTCKYTRQ